MELTQEQIDKLATGYTILQGGVALVHLADKDEAMAYAGKLDGDARLEIRDHRKGTTCRIIF